MNIKLHIKTPKGHAKSIESQLRIFLLGKLKKPPNTYLSPTKDEFYWELNNITVKQYFKIERNTLMFKTLAGGTLDQINKKSWMKKMANITNNTIAGARILIDETTVEIIKTNKANKLIPEEKITMWEKIKKTFTKE